MQQVIAATRNPFRLSVGPDAVFSDGGWGRAYEQALAAVLGPPRLIFIVGEPGTGKSLLLAALADALKARHLPAFQIRRGEIPPPERDRAILLVDEGDRLDETACRRIVERAPSLPCVIAGSPTLPVWFGDAALGSAVIALGLMSAEEVGGFLEDRLARAGLPLDLFVPEAVAALAAYAHGIPRVVAILASSAWLVSGSSPETRITTDDIVEAVTIRDGVPPDTMFPTEPRIAVASETATPTPEPEVLSERATPRREPEQEAVPHIAETPSPSTEAPPTASAPEPNSMLVETRLAATTNELSVVRATQSDIMGPIGIPPRKHEASLKSSPFHLTVLFAAFAIVAYAAFFDRGVIDDRLAAPDAVAPARTVSAASEPSLPTPARPAQATPAAQPGPIQPVGSASTAPPAAATPMASSPTETPSAGAVVPPPAPEQPATHVLVRYRQGDAGARRRAAALAGKLREAGLQVDDPQPAGRSIALSELQYFFDEDRDAAAAISAYLGPRSGHGALSRPNPEDPSIRRGTIEIWIPGTPPRRQQRPPEEEEDASE